MSRRKWGSRYRDKLDVAIKEEGIKSIAGFLDSIEYAASSDREADSLLIAMARLLSPPSCDKYHCEHNTSYAYCCCNSERKRNECPDWRSYNKRRKIKSGEIAKRVAISEKRSLASEMDEFISDTE